MNHEQNSFSNSTKSSPVEINLDEFMISEESFKPMTKGLGFHQDQKRVAFKPSPKEVKPFGSNSSMNKQLPQSLASSVQPNVAAHVPSGLEAFYGATPTSALTEKISEFKSEEKISKPNYQTAGMANQFSAWIIDLLVIASFVAITGALLVLVSGIEIQMYSKLISVQDLALFSAAIFSIYYLLYFTILDLTASPGKTMLGLKVVKSDGKALSVKNTFTRAFISLLSGVALFLPMVLDFQGRLSDTKVVK